MRFIFLYVFLILIQLLAITQRGHFNTTIPLEYWARPFILGSLWVYFWKNSTDLAKPKQRNYLLVAIAIYWFGEMNFMLTSNIVTTSILHIIGHIACILAFNQDNPLKNFFKPKNYLILSFALITSFIFDAYFLLELPFALCFSIIVYSLVGSAWFFAAFNRLGFVPTRSEKLVLLGVVLAISNNFIYSMNLFISDLPPTDFIVTPLFAMAYYLIAEGILSNKKEF
jgi:YhhN family